MRTLGQQLATWIRTLGAPFLPDTRARGVASAGTAEANGPATTLSTAPGAAAGAVAPVGPRPSTPRPPSHAQLETERLSPSDYERLWQTHFSLRQESYFTMHKRRYYELLNTWCHYRSSLPTPARVLEIGVSEYLPFYKHFFPDIRLVTVDRPEVQHGFSPDYCLEKGRADYHHEIDLNQDALAPDRGSPPLGTFDWIICTEVMEHLIVNPVEFLEDLRSLLTPAGFIYLTTPNFFRYDNMQKLARSVNPQMIYPRRGGNLDAHHHFREYDVNELLAFAAAAGLRVEAYGLSGCWDSSDLLQRALREHPEQRSNIVMVMRNMP